MSRGVQSPVGAVRAAVARALEEDLTPLGDITSALLPSGLTGNALRSFYQAAYRPNGTILGVAGDIDWPRLKDAVGQLFSDWKPRPEPPL